MSTRNISGSKGGWCVRLTTYHHTVLLSRNLGALTSLDPSGPAWPVTGVLFTVTQVFYEELVRFPTYVCPNTVIYHLQLPEMHS